MVLLLAWTTSAQVSLPLPPPQLLQGSEGMSLPPAPSSAPTTPNVSANPTPESNDTLITAPPIEQPKPEIPPIFQGPSNAELLSRIDRLETKIASLDEQLRIMPKAEVPGIIKDPFSFNVLLIVNIITFILVLYLLTKSKTKAVPSGQKAELPALRNVKDYMRKYISQGYQVQNMKSFLIGQGYPSDIVERAAREIEAETGFRSTQ